VIFWLAHCVPSFDRLGEASSPPSGRPYFDIELVKGIPITQYCDAERLTPKERLELFVPVCQAVQHAHQKGIIHRDLKPSNVLVALYDGRPVPKVIDFGVAKATGGQLTAKTLVTGFGSLVGTLEYMSPEECYFWATHSGAELDLLIVRGRQRLGFEIKRTVAPRLTPSMRSAMQDLRLTRLDVIHAGQETFPLADQIRAVSMTRMLEDLTPLR
jgi:hypothetical protein